MSVQFPIVLNGKDCDLEVYEDKVVLRNKIKVSNRIIDGFVNTIYYKSLSEISFQNATLFKQGYIRFICNYNDYSFSFSLSQNKDAYSQYTAIKEYHNNHKLKEEQEKQARLQEEADRLNNIENQKLNNPEEFQRKTKLCEDVYKEYAALFKTIKDTDDIYEKVAILKECYRKLDVIDTTHHYNDCFRYMEDEMEKVEKKAISVLNAYIKDERASGSENYEIDIMQFSDDLNFIYSWICDKDEKLNR